MLYRDGDTIVAPATPPGTGALAVVRLSGPESARIGDEIFRGGVLVTETEPRTVLHGEIVDAEGNGIDEVLLVRFAAPRSYTGEDAVEISCHGGPYLVRRIVDRAVEAGARPAAPGEFTRRAFVSGRIDLAQAESVADLIRARTEGAARSALRQLSGDLSERFRFLREALLDVLAAVEGELDFAAEEEVPGYDRASAGRTVESVGGELARLEAEGEKGRLVREGVRVAILGRPNSGKSTLFNVLLGEERAIVSAEPGTTRDLLEGETEIGGLLFHLTDTAGLREAEGVVEEEGVRRARKRGEEAELLLVVIDRSAEITGDDREVLASTEGRRRIVVLAKSDLPPAPIAGRESPIRSTITNGRVPGADGGGGAGAGDDRGAGCRAPRLVPLSAVTGEGMDDLRNAMSEAMDAKEVEALGDGVVTSVRHLEGIRAAKEALDRAKGVIDEGELLAEELREAVRCIGGITGEGAREEVLDRIFSRFCLGK